MPYIGRDLNRGNYLKLDDISSSFDSSTTTFNLTVGGSAFTPGSAFAILVSVGGVIQEPESAYQVNNSEITFANAPTAQDSFFCIALGVALGIGVPGNGTVNGTQLAKPFSYDGYFDLDSTNNRVGINSSTPTVALDVIGDIKLNGNLVTGGGGGGNFGIVTCTGLDLNGNGDVSGNFVIGGDLTVNGTTTTLDTNLTEVDRVEVGANSNTLAGIAVTQSGSADLVQLYDGASQVVTIDDTGNVGLGSAIPGSLLNLASNNPLIRLTDSDNGAYSTIGGEGGNLYLYTNSTARDFIFRGTGEVARLTGDGKLGIGTHTPASIFHLNSSSSAEVKLTLQNTGGTTAIYGNNDDIIMDADKYRIRNNDGSTEYIRITSAGNLGVGTDNPLQRLHVKQGSTTTPAMVEALGAKSHVKFQHNAGNSYTATIGSKTLGANNVGLTFDTGYNGAVQRMTIDVDGNVGIGTDSPTSRLTIAEDGSSTNAELAINYTGTGTRTSAIRFQRGGTNFGYVAGAAFMLTTGGVDDLAIAPVSGKNLLFGIGDSEKLRITSAGNVGLGTTNPATNIHIVSDKNALIKLESTDANSGIQFIDPDTGAKPPVIYGVGDDFTVWTDFLERFRVTSAGKVGIGSTIPEQRLTVAGATDITHYSNTTINNNRLQLGFNAPEGYIKAKNSTGSPAANIALYTTDTGGNTNKTMHLRYDGNVGIGTNNPSDKLSIYAAPNSLVFGAKDTTRGNHIFQLLADDSAGNGELRLYRNSGSGNHEHTVEIASHGNSYFLQGNIGIGTNNPSSGKLQVQDGGIAVRGAATPNINFSPTDGNSGNADIAFDGNDLKIISNSSSANIRIAAYSKDNHIVIRPNGRVGIGTDNPSTQLQIVGSTDSVDSSGGTLGIRQKGDTKADGITLTSSHANSARFWKDSDGTLHIYNTGGSSDDFVLTNTGNVGINSAIPNCLLNVMVPYPSGTTDAIIISRPDYGTVGKFTNSGGALEISSDKGLFLKSDYDNQYTAAGSKIAMEVDGTEWARITPSGNFKEILFPQQNDDTFAQRVYRTTVSANANDYTKFATVTGPSYATHIKMSTTSTIGNVVTSADFEIKVGHSNDILVISKTLAYTNVTIKVVSDGNQSFDLYIKRSGGYNTSSNSSHKIAIHPCLQDEVTFNSTENYSAQTHEHTTSYGAFKITGVGGPDGNLVAAGSVTGSSKNFSIPHPLSSLTSTNKLVHSSIEGPQLDLIYRGKVTLSSGSATVNIDTVSGMSDGTFVLLNRDVQCFTTNETGWSAVKGSVSGNVLTITAQDSSSTDTISWMVVGERQDDTIKSSNVTDDSGKLIVEPLNDENVDTSHLHQFYPHP